MERTEQLKAIVDECRDLILKTERAVWACPETGYKEWKTTAHMEKLFEELGYSLVKAGDIPGFYTDLDTGKPGPRLAILGELDSLAVASHPDADPKTKAVHACGHNVQCAILAGVAAALKKPGALDGLCGSIRLMAVPAEEMIQIGFREELRKQGTIHYLGGKVEFIYRGYFDGVDMSMMIHAGVMDEGQYLKLNPGCNGLVAKSITFKGVSAHAGGSPEKGVNALYAANTALSAANALRETFVDEEHIRFHPIITEGGTVVNAIPEQVKVESYVRGATSESIVEYNKKLNRAMAASAAAIGAGLLIEDRPGYFPLNNDKNLLDLAAEVMRDIAGPDSVVVTDHWDTGSTDMGDVSCIMPVVHPYGAGASGILHGTDFQVTDPERACVAPAKCLFIMADRLLSDDAALAKKVLAESKPLFSSKEEYLKAIDQLDMTKEAVVYNEDGTVLLDYQK
ncbi:MAG: amidohydrolase [Lachnospiraceae bacterium]|jgi:amidohydrolase|nr:amidohydrolase [Lachnospiraceae bacterium]